jgi:ABC-type transport system substrate-binding protein
MSKVETLLKIIEYRKEHPDAADAQVSSAIGISERYVKSCNKELRELFSHFLRSVLNEAELGTLMSKLRPSNGYEMAILGKLQGLYLGERDGTLEIASPEDRPSKDYLRIGIWSPGNSSERVRFWLENLLYEPLLRDEEGEGVDYRLASECKNVDGYSRWHIRLKGDVHWSDGKPITSDDITYSLARSALAPSIKEVGETNERELTLVLNRDRPMLRHELGHIPILPSHTSSYSVISGPFVLRRSRSQNLFHLYRNRDYYRADYPKVEWISLKIFRRFAFALRAVERKSMDILRAKSLHQVDERSFMIPQRLFCGELSYYVLLVSKRKKGSLEDEGAMDRLRRSIDYSAINIYLSAYLSQGIRESRHSKGKLDLTIGYLADMDSRTSRELSLIIASSLGVDPSSVVDVRRDPAVKPEEVDAFVTQIYFGYGYSRLRRYFHSEGESNISGFSFPEVDSLIDRLDRTASMSEREIIGQAVLRKLQRENAVIILAPSFEYLLSNLYITPRLTSCSISELIFHLPNVRVSRNRASGKDRPGL